MNFLTKFFVGSKKQARKQRQNAQATRQFLQIEKLEDRRVLAGCALDNLDTSGDGWVSPIDALIVINSLTGQKIHQYDPMSSEQAANAANFIFEDVDFDGWITPRDALLVINYLNTNGSHPFLLECPIVDPALVVIGNSLSETDTAVSNDYVPLASFDMLANTDQLFINATFVAVVGSMADVEMFDLWADTDGDWYTDTIIASATSNGNSVTFHDVYYVTPEGGDTLFEVYGHIASSLSDDQFQLAFADGDPILAEDVRTGGTVFNITIFPAEWTLYTLERHGALTVMSSDTPLRSSYVLGGSADTTAIRFDMMSTFETSEVYYIGIAIDGDSSQVDRVNFYYDGDTEPFGSANAAGSRNPDDDLGMRLENFQLIAWEDLITSIHGNIVVKTDVNGGISGKEFSLKLSSFGARGLSTANSLPVTYGSVIAGPKETVVMSELAGIRNANPDADNTNVPTGISNVGQFKFTTVVNANTQNGQNKDVMEDLTFVVDTMNVALTTTGGDSSPFRLLNKADTSVYVQPTTVVQTSPGTYTVMFNGLSMTPVNTAIDSGSNITLVLQANISNAHVSASSPSSLQVRLDVDSLKRRDRDAATDKIFGEDLLEDVYSTKYRT